MIQRGLSGRGADLEREASLELPRQRDVPGQDERAGSRHPVGVDRRPRLPEAGPGHRLGALAVTPMRNGSSFGLMSDAHLGRDPPSS